MKYRFALIISIFALLYIVILSMFFAFYRELALKDAKQEALHVLNTMNAVRDYVSNVQRPLIDQLKQSGDLSPEFFDPRLLSSSYITREIYEIQLQKQNINYSYKLIATDPLNPAHQGTPFEYEILENFKEKKYEEYSQIIYDSNASYIYVGLPIKNSQASCVVCHNINSAPKKMIEQYKNIENFQGQVGDTIAMISFKIPVKHILSYHKNEFIASAIALLIIVVVLLLFVFKIHQKVAKIKEQNEQLMINQSRLASMGEMIGNISHQWKQPLAQISSILINLELFNERGKLTKETLNEKIKETDEQVKFMSETIDDFKNFFNPNAPKSEFSSYTAISQAIKLLRAPLKKHCVNVLFEPEQNFTLFGNVNEIIQILINIINNAKEAFDGQEISEKQVKISSLINENSKIITIENNAGNIDDSVINKIFEPNFTTKKSGSGLGLYMSQMIIKKYNGEISVRNVNNGVIFTINIFNS
ncbi:MULTISPECIES: c-type heme family protein [unclassified Campylobacter]|uniref:c-type heme family protein n=1 Tax=unclassified Campylobacter TaxID=2593542 RepID=UPI003D354542